MAYIVYKAFELRRYITDGMTGAVDITKFDLVFDKMMDLNIDRQTMFEVILHIQNET